MTGRVRDGVPERGKALVAELGSEPGLAVGAPSGGLTLVVMSPTGAGSVPAPGAGTLVLGRAEQCDVRIEDSRLSRRHAELRFGGGVHFVDLGSRNGSFVRNERASPHVPVRVRIGDAIAIGGTLLTLQRAVTSARPRHVWSHGYFEARLEEECASAARDGAPFAVVRLRLEPARADALTQDAASESTALLAELDGADMLASYAPDEYEALFTRVSVDEADARAADLARRLKAIGAPFALAMAAFPRDGRTPEALIEHTSRSLRRPPSAREREVAVEATPIGAIERMDAVVRRVAAGVINVLILGETGVGKDVLARRIHDVSPREKMPLVSINCGGLAESLLETELFGHEKGAFTGALQAKRGLLESADGGTVFLDEVGEMPLATQVKLLRVIEQREVTRVGALRPRAIDVRFLAATNRDLEGAIAEGRFRQDLYFRLNGITLSLPPLRERVEEIEPLAREFVAQACRAVGRRDRPSIAAEAMKTLVEYRWPGNVRELRNFIERAVLLCPGDVITRENLPIEKMGAVVAHGRPGHFATRMAPPPAPALGHEKSVTVPAPPLPTGDGERERIVDALDRCAGNQSQAARALGISRATLIRRIEEYGIRRPRKAGV
jgi:two-component system response regulator AtoC